MKCEVCCSDRWSKGGKLTTCLSCGFKRANDDYYEQPFVSIYSNDYYLGGEYSDYQAEGVALRRNFSDRLSKIRKHKKSGKLLEIGSAHGFFLEMAQNFFEVEGVEVNKDVATKVEKRLGVKVSGGSFDEFNLEATRYDCVVALDVIEHLRHPRGFLETCRRVLHPGGFLFIETGDISALVPKLQGERWRLIYPPSHLSYFSASTLSKILKECGFEVISVERVWFWRTLRQILFRSFPKFFTLMPDFLSRLCFSVSIPMFTGDLIFVTAKREG